MRQFKTIPLALVALLTPALADPSDEEVSYTTIHNEKTQVVFQTVFRDGIITITSSIGFIPTSTSSSLGSPSSGISNFGSGNSSSTAASSVVKSSSSVVISSVSSSASASKSSASSSNSTSNADASFNGNYLKLSLMLTSISTLAAIIL